MDNSAAKTIKITGNIPVHLPVKTGNRFLFISYDQGALTHGLHKYPAKFFPELPRWIIQRYSKAGDQILDPFMGSGTTNLEASLLGRESVGIDIDPFSRFLAKVKTTPLPVQELLKSYSRLKAKVKTEPKQLQNVPEFPYRDKWFKPYILKELAHIKASIETLQTSYAIKDFFLVCFSSIIRQVSEADNNCTRTVIRKKLNKQVHSGNAISLFLKKITIHTNNMIRFTNANPSGNVAIPKKIDARDMSVFQDEIFDLALTSPPYLNAVDYPRTHQLEIYWLGFASGSLKSLKSQHVGSEVVSAKDYSKFHKTGNILADRVIHKIYKVDPRRAYIATKYIRDMIANLREVYRVLKYECPYVIVVGNNLVRGFQFETWRYLQEEAPKIGYKVECCFVSEIINHFIKVPRKERINDDHVLVLRK